MQSYYWAINKNGTTPNSNIYKTFEVINNNKQTITMKIKPLTKQNAKAYQKCRLNALRIEPDAFGADYNIRKEKPLVHFEQRVTYKSNHFIMGAFVKDELIGTVGFYAETMPKLQHRGNIWGVFVYPEHRKKGIARAMFQATLKAVAQLPEVKQIHLGVSENNPPAIQLYKSFGFKTYAIEPRTLFVNDQYINEQLMILMLD